ncbi:AP-4 complex subunit mu-1-like isoform X2 [Dreissena polymorpha]|nr:AP-4 complex subunit mu-1-like isoform X2 [Dreissena polymorpha]
MLPVMVIEILSRIYHICKDFCGVVSEASLQANILLVYELLQEIMNEGYMQLDVSSKIQPYIQSTAIIVHKEKSTVKDLTSRAFGIDQVTSQVSAANRPITQTARSSDGKGFYVDVVEKVVATIAADGAVSNMQVNGSIIVRNFLAESQQFKMVLNEDLVIAEPKAKGYGSNVQLDGCSFHECVNHEEFEAHRYLLFTPPVGEFTAMTYSSSGELCLTQPFTLRLFVAEREAGSRDVNVVLRLTSNYPPNIVASKVSVRVPVLSSIASISSKLSADNQASEFSKRESSIIWTLKNVPGKTECMADFRLNNQGSTMVTRRDLDPAILDFEISGYTCTGLAIRHLKARGKEKQKQQQQQQQQQQQFFVRCVTVSDSYLLRTF